MSVMKAVVKQHVSHTVEVPGGYLTELQDAFVEHYVGNGGQLKQAAKAAGYAEGSASNEAYRLMRMPLIQQEIYRRTMSALAAHAPKALKSVEQLMTSAKSELVRLQAAQDWLDRAGFKPIDRKDIRVAGDIKVSIDPG